MCKKFFSTARIPLLVLLSFLASGNLWAMPQNRYFDKIDRNHDHYIDMGEHNEATRMIFEHIDANGDGFMGAEELQGKAVGRDMIEKEYIESKADVNHDRRISLEEFEQLRMGQFKMADLNGDKLISPRELDSFYKFQAYSRIDSDGNGCITPKEFMRFRFRYTRYTE